MFGASAGSTGSGTPQWFSLQIGLVHLVAIDSMLDFALPTSPVSDHP